MAGGKEIKRQAGKRTDLINSIIDKLDSRIEASQRALLKTIVDDFLDGMEKDEAGNIKNTLANKRRFAMFDSVYARFAKDNGLAAVQSIAEGVGKIVDFNANYFSAFTTAAELAPINANVKTTLSAWLGLTPRGNVAPNGYLDTLIKDATVKNQIKNLMLKNVVSQNGFFETKKALQQTIEGTPDKLGALQRYYRNFAYDTFSVVDRTNQKIFADKLKFNYAIYEGGLIETSRKFCEDHNGNVYSREEIAKFKPTEAIGPGYDPFTDLGGYGCRHHLNWVPDSVAFALRPDLKNQPPANDQKAIEEPPKPIEKPKPAAPAKKKEPTPTADTKNIYKKFNSVEEGKNLAKKIFGDNLGIDISSVEAHSGLTTKRMNAYLKQFGSLASEYELFKGYNKEPAKLYFQTGLENANGFVATTDNGTTITRINFGHKPPGGMDERKYIKGSTYLRQKSRVDSENEDIATVTHEFAHMITRSSQLKSEFKGDPRIREFWKELNKMNSEYLGEVKKLGSQTQKINEIFLGRYASTHPDEFFAEAFAEYKLSSNPSKYAKKVGILVDKIFKR